MRRPLTALLAAAALLLTPPLAGASLRPKAKAKKKRAHAASTASKMPTAAQLAAEQAQRVAQAMLLLEQQQADQAADLGGGSYQGASIPSRYGPIEVTITIAGGKITDCNGTWDIDIPRSIQIDTAAFPLLQTDCVSTGTAKLHQISGATLSVNAFIASLQSALVKAHLSTVGAIQLGPY
jgi:uncharacterized protein with FMN-binding domain